ncbi:MAG: hypothetical protein KA184_08450 [Candidatus Hydrogenedentes bacterium]|nr:hypothetical protein [Candidatus Hydrogenedentota bacterium]
MRVLLYIVIAVLSFLAVLAGAMAATGLLNAASFERLLGRAPEEPAPLAQPAASPEDSLSGLARRLNEREEALVQRETDLKRREAEFSQRNAALLQLQTSLEERLKEVKSVLEQSDAEEQLRRKTTATTLELMDPKKAAERLNGLPPEEVAAILRLVKDKQRAKIVEQVTPDEATRILRLLQEPPL